MTKSVVILGVGKGFGYSIAKKFGEDGKLPIMVARNSEKLRGFVQDLADEGIKADYAVADVTKPDQVKRVFEESFTKYGVPETLVYNVGNTTLDTPFSQSIDEIMDEYQTNVFGAVTATRLFVGMSTNKTLGRNILITGGKAAEEPEKDNVTLSATKAALSNYAVSLGDAIADDNIYVGLISIQGIEGSKEELEPDCVADVYVKAARKRSKRIIKYPKL